MTAPGAGYAVHSRWGHLLERVATEVSVTQDGYEIAGIPQPVPGHGRIAHERAVLAAMTSELYSRYYLHHGSPPMSACERIADKRPPFAREDSAYGRRLRDVVAGRHRWEPGWRVLPGTGARIQVERNGLVLHVTEEEISPDGDGVLVRFPTDHPYASPGYFLVTGTAGPHTDGPTTRIYLHLTAEGAPTVFGSIIAAFDQSHLRYSAKLLNNPIAYTRPDAAVLYVRSDDLSTALAIVLDVRGANNCAFRHSEPAFTARAAPGLGLADEPMSHGLPVSFGQHRCGILARGLLAAGVDANTIQRRDAICAELLGNGLRLERLHLNPGALDYRDRLVGTKR